MTTKFIMLPIDAPNFRVYLEQEDFQYASYFENPAIQVYIVYDIPEYRALEIAELFKDILIGWKEVH